MNAIDITKQIGVLIPPIKLEKESTLVDNYLHYPPKKTLWLNDITQDHKDLLTPDELSVILLFIHLGGCGGDAALKVQNKMWDRYRGKSISMLKTAIKKCGWKPEEVLWDMYPIGYKPNGGSSCLS
ncbi:hypothetical protein pETSU_067 [Edwardsiella phage pEt-SU]|uniref:Uncharacterized protein n=1 Tax=Edwardsiella phage pEt-SU TaxID=2562142 RepID=A0A4D6DWP6_9CAUD|nr:hypothetical protein HOV39_gp067 [Edwardsiella phage pEt-SU]QBZ70648.1 hypothetical protein pETSU_067 [Edwardsiella phage pEt-SU]